MDEKKPTIVLHIGLHKTGTTSIQRFLHVNYEALLRQGVLYPLAGRLRKDGERHESHLMLAWSVVERYARKYDVRLSEKPWMKLREEIEEKKPDRVVLSSEFFWPATTQEIQTIRGYLSGYSVRTIVYVRDPVNYAVSSYKQAVKAGGYEDTIVKFVTERLWQYDTHGVLSRWESVFGKKSVSCYKYERCRSRLTEHFVEAAHIHWSDQLSSVEPKNVSPPDNVVHFIRRLNILERWLKPTPLRIFIARARRNILASRVPGRWVAWLMSKFSSCPIATRQDIEDIYTEIKGNGLLV
jgi:hypothetical protein